MAGDHDAANGGLGDALDVVAKDLAVALVTTTSKPQCTVNAGAWGPSMVGPSTADAVYL